MFSTKSVHSLRKLFAGYHEPLTLSKQQSQKLLDGLKTSFRNQLDREYGRSSGATDPGPDHAHPNSNSHSHSLTHGHGHGHGHPRARRSAASVHLKSILSNPLFSYNNNSSSSINSNKSSPAAAAALSSAMALPHRDRDPMDVFDHAVSRGMMTLDAAAGCLVAKHQLGHPPADTALRVVRWLRSSREGKGLAFLDDQPFVRALAPFLVAENLDAVAWEWIVASMRDEAAIGTVAGSASAAAEADPRARRAAFLLAQLVRVKSQPRHGNLDAAIQAILRAEQLFPRHPLLPRLLTTSWRSVSWLSTVESYSRTAPSEALFDAHMAVAARLPRPFAVETAHLHLHHPTHPDHLPALRFFSDTDRLRRLAGPASADPEGADGAKARALGLVPWIAFLGQDTVNHLKQSGRNQEAQGVTDLLRSELSGIFGATLSPT
ncbi:hypothetical protein ESCO_004688 [Escovopsis weberi]|uniref:Uncharacterized protein n=1 Tax=Escovopsis weberi TaxID=150374 RepID=A0A0M9VRH5_ESCWE|nr:hypothetical protein ESCO_004688 [Escovopsis weberi]